MSLLRLAIAGIHRPEVSPSPAVARLAGLGGVLNQLSSPARLSAHRKRVASCSVALTLLIGGAEGCSRSTEPAAATVQFKYVNSLCAGTMITFEFSIDHRVVGAERFRDGQTSQAYSTSPGAHVIGATIPTLGRSFLQDTTVVLAAGQTFTREMFVYCS
jgi:hypothetical protein